MEKKREEGGEGRRGEGDRRDGRKGDSSGGHPHQKAVHPTLPNTTRTPDLGLP